ncbi:MAG: 3-isopropylmalate dehydrogenase [Candidatus Dormibacteraeota bacterium]|uniref:3-isopropylmalate dehydrogenase n=1 Tax=Candidatus Amunia macphersoniae TaxID=3127014 RepID=A0A934NG35_9BACT|nr:3-isopropylmalate dehydrogenase [Candidatus Dormibacteraeota bacterium]
MTFAVVALPGDGVGVEVTAAAVAVLRAVAGTAGIDLVTEERLIGGRAIEETGGPLPDDTLSACRTADAVLLGAVGGPRWDHLSGGQRCEAGLLGLRAGLGVFANLRPVRPHPRLVGLTALRPGAVAGVDLVVVRELTGGAYFARPKRRDALRAVDTIVYTRDEVERVARVAFSLASQRRGRLTSVDKANVLATSELWRETVSSIALEFPAVTLEHALVDSFAMRLVQRPRDIDVVVTENLFGDILSDEAGVLVGSLGLLPSASLGAGGPGLYEPVHGSAPEIAGMDCANPYGAILSVALMLRHSLQRPDLGAAVEAAVDACIDDGVLTADLGGTTGTAAVGEAVVAALAAGARVTAEVGS